MNKKQFKCDMFYNIDTKKNQYGYTKDGPNVRMDIERSIGPAPLHFPRKY